MALQVHADLDANEWVGFQRSTDSPNLFGTASVKISDLPRIAQGAGGSSAQGSVPARYSADRAKYGKDSVRWTVGTVVTANILIGYNGVSSWTIPANLLPTDTYTLVVWAKRITGNNNNFRIAAYRDSAVLIANGTSQTVSDSAWTKFTLTFSFTATASDDRIYLMFQRTNGDGTTQNIDITGAMLVAGSTAPDWFNCGAASLLEDLTPYGMEAKWTLGYTRRYQYVAAVGKAELILKNADKRFSPEYSSGPLYGTLKPNLLVQIGDPDYGVWWTGWTDNWSPEPGTSRSKRAMLSATDARRFLAQRPPVEWYSLELPAVIIADLKLNYSLPNTTAGLPDASDGASAWYSVISETSLIETYGEGVGYDWDGVKVFTDLMTGIQGHAWFGRAGALNTATQQGDSTPASYTTLSDTVWMEAGYEEEKIVNQCEAKAYIRKFQSAGPYTVWESDATIALAAGESEVIRVFFTHDTDTSLKIGAGGLSVSGTLSSGVFGTAVTAALSDIGATSALLTLTNTTGGAINVVTAVVSASARAYIKRELSKEREDSASITANGTLSERIDSLFVQDRTWAKKLSRYIVNRFKDPRRVIPWVTLQANKNPTEAFACHIGAPVLVSDTQTAHSAYYGVIGEEHTVKEGLKNHTVKVYLEPLYDTSVTDTPTA